MIEFDTLSILMARDVAAIVRTLSKICQNNKSSSALRLMEILVFEQNLVKLAKS